MLSYVLDGHRGLNIDIYDNECRISQNRVVGLVEIVELRIALQTPLSRTYRYCLVVEDAKYALLGFIVVFVGIAFLIFVVWLVGKIMHPTGNVAAKKVEEKTTEAVPMAAGQTAAATASDEVDDETLVVIMAALMAYYDRQNNKCEFTLKRIKRI